MERPFQGTPHPGSRGYTGREVDQLVTSSKKIQDAINEIRTAIYGEALPEPEPEPQRALSVSANREDDERELWEPEDEWLNGQIRLSNTLKKSLQSADEDLYLEWLKGYVQSGKKISDYRPNAFPHMFVAYKNIFVPELHGAFALNIIVPKNVTVTFSELGHNSLYLFKDFQYKGSFLPNDYKGMLAQYITNQASK